METDRVGVPTVKNGYAQVHWPCNWRAHLRMQLRLPLRRSMIVRIVVVSTAFIAPLITLPRLPEVSVWPVVLGLLPWILGKYLLCPLRWHALSESGKRRWWHLRTYAESELLGLLTPGHVGADVWRVNRLA